MKAVLLILAFVLALLASWPPANTRVHLGRLSLASFVATFIPGLVP